MQVVLLGGWQLVGGRRGGPGVRRVRSSRTPRCQQQLQPKLQLQHMYMIVAVGVACWSCR
jgi:hypothetical protein